MKTIRDTENRIDKLREEVQARPEAIEVQKLWANLDALWAALEAHKNDKKAHK